MMVTVLQENLHLLISRVSRVSPVRPQLAILQNILLSAKDGEITGVGSSLETTIISRVGAKVQKEGSVCVPARLFAELVASLPAGGATLSLDKEGFKVSCGATSASLSVIDAAEYPPVAGGTRKKIAAFEPVSFLETMKMVLFAASSDETRPLFSGIKLSGGEGELTAVATDGYRLSLARINKGPSGSLDIVAPSKAVSEVIKLVGEDKGGKEIVLEKIDEHQLVFTFGDSSIITRLVDGEYPVYQKIIPKTHTTRMIADTTELLRAVKSAAIFARDNSNIVKMSVSPEGCEISANTPSVGENKVGIEAKVEGEAGTIAFNSRFLLEFLSTFSEKEVAFEMTGSLNPGVFMKTKGDEFLHIIMPVRTQG